MGDISKVFLGSATSNTHTISLKPYIQDQATEDLLMWRNLTRSGIVFGVISVVYFIIAWSGFSFSFLLGNLLLLIIFGALVWYNFGKSMNYPPLPLPQFFKNGISEKDVQEFTQNHIETINKALEIIHRLASGKDTLLTLKAAGALFAITRVFSIFSPFTLAYLVAFFAFTVPKFYEMRKDEIDVVGEELSIYVQQGYDFLKVTVLDKIPTAKKME
eukprot:TRINITY_DN43082_c0_g1_i2.p2 TRINITY_DN43082_c0_g1~~TRINITY_DN43082_c0_g1_i2.p2  ORF type:complete len:216 (+),score=17.64 TRINITY_DN43082_c0_g1_i2:283-930(+)